MTQEYIRNLIVRYSKELAETTDYNEVKRLKRKIASLKKLYEPTEPKSLTDLITGK